ncbi:xanthine dehydrogenase family protein molybdopterin-binding subunit [Saccharopolyspora sp. 6T]|uniref:xanthine dehydrogenase family protein molybdopterin-binding subunit n=1 Tax=Saccharopolyspora sp. 6T TaxID=2877238 RepID=UPI001CD2F6FC|nr:xanthine dehydrogenase family protein molybdopterin-binding subunit [Saccharopolyspora sp. 6T]MCA1185203.1 xanthine dehydrogenase family protein molybdopterin-binding subunit [Saccharopolyspora sp. 6T]
MTDLLRPRAIGAPLERLDGPDKINGTARYAFEHPVPDPLYVHPVQATIARGRIEDIDVHAAEDLDGVATVLTHENAPRLATDSDAELWVLQSPEIAFRGQLIGAVLAETPEIARQAADLVRVDYRREPHHVVLRGDDDALYAPEVVNPSFAADTRDGDPDGAEPAVVVDATYTTPMEHNNPMEPHATIATWRGGVLTMYDSTQGVHQMRSRLAPVLGLDPERIRVLAPHVGGGFGSKGTAHAHNALAALAARVAGGRPVKLALTRQQMFALVGYRTPTIQHVRLGADRDGKLELVTHDVVEQTSTVQEFAEQTAVGTRTVYAAPNRRTTHRLAALDVPVPFWMRAPGEAPGMFATESAVDELAEACGIDPIDLRCRNEPAVDPATGLPYSARHLAECLREGAERFGWAGRDPAPRSARDGDWLVGTGVASATYPGYKMPGSTATVRYRDGRYEVRIGAADIGTGTRTALTQIAADALDRPVSDVDLELGDTALPTATVEGGSSGLTSWGTTVVEAARRFREKFGHDPADGDEADGAIPDDPDEQRYAIHSFGAHFAEVRVNADTGEVRVPRLLGVFSVGRVVNPRLVRSQLLGGITMGMSMALFEHSVLDPQFGHVINHDLAQYHVAAHADVADIEVSWLDEHDPHSNPMGSRGVGEIGIVGSPAAIANAVHHATGIRVRDLPITPDKLLGG